jgi:hypothetical protein
VAAPEYHLDFVKQEIRKGDFVAAPSGRNAMTLYQVIKLTAKQIRVQQHNDTNLDYFGDVRTRLLHPHNTIKLSGKELTALLMGM